MEKIVDPVLSIFAGLGLFFVGIKLLNQNLKHMSGSRVKAVIDRGSKTFLSALFCGIAAGFLTQSARALYLITASLVSAELLSVKQALPILQWGNLGRALFVLILILPFGKVCLFLLGAMGICFAFEKPKTLRFEVGAVFGVALFLFGLDLVKEGTAGFLQFPWFLALLGHLKGQNALSFLLGMIATFLCQSHVGITCIAITLAQSGIIDQDQSIMILYGTHAGSSLISYILSLQFEGTSRQIVMSQVLFNALGSILFVGLFYLETWGNVPLVKALIQGLDSDLGRQAAYIAVFFSIPTAVGFSLCSGPFLQLLGRLWPPSSLEDLGKPRYIDPNVIDHLPTVVMLTEKELGRATGRFRKYLESLVSDSATREEGGMEALHQANSRLLAKIGDFLSQVDSEKGCCVDAHLIGLTGNIHKQVSIVESELYHFVIDVKARKATPHAEQIVWHLMEAVEAAVLTMVSVIDSRDKFELEVLFQITGDQSTYLVEIRKKYLEVEQRLELDERLFILGLHSHMERILLPLGRFAGFLYQRITPPEERGVVSS